MKSGIFSNLEQPGQKDYSGMDAIQYMRMLVLIFAAIDESFSSTNKTDDLERVKLLEHFQTHALAVGGQLASAALQERDTVVDYTDLFLAQLADLSYEDGLCIGFTVFETFLQQNKFSKQQIEMVKTNAGDNVIRKNEQYQHLLSLLEPSIHPLEGDNNSQDLEGFSGVEDGDAPDNISITTPRK